MDITDQQKGTISVDVRKYLAIDLTANNAHCYPDKDPPPDFGWGVCKHGSGLQEFGDGYMVERIARARAAALNAGRSATTIPTRIRKAEAQSIFDATGQTRC